MTEREIQKYGEIQYLKGRLDELHKAFPTVLSMERSRKLDHRIQKYYTKLGNIDPVAYHLYLVETMNRKHAKDNSKTCIKILLEKIVATIDIGDETLLEQIESRISELS
tara:strand:+ start:123 stop:449 length:327 start_codon:yes stop_codon:yes gene_type:complete